MRFLRSLNAAVDYYLTRFKAFADDLDRRSRSGEFGKYPWQKDYGLWPWQRRRRPK